jgi:flagellar biogenesis protein FliO
MSMRQASVSGAPAIPFKRDAAGAGTPLAGGAIGVLLVSAIAIVGVLLVRRRLRLNAPGAVTSTHLKVLETRRLGPRALLSVVEFEGNRYLIAQGEQGISCLASAPTRGDA